MVRKLLQLLLESDKYAERKGAAYGLAGLVKGLGILSLKQQDIMTTLTDAIQDKKNARRREGKCLLGRFIGMLLFYLAFKCIVIMEKTQKVQKWSTNNLKNWLL